MPQSPRFDGAASDMLIFIDFHAMKRKGQMRIYEQTIFKVTVLV